MRHDRPVIEVVLTLALGGPKVTRTLLADTGAAGNRDPFELILEEVDCLMCGAIPSALVGLGGSYQGLHPRYGVRIMIPQLSFGQSVFAVGVAKPPDGFDGITCFRFLNRFTYGNFGDPATFGLETWRTMVHAVR